MSFKCHGKDAKTQPRTCTHTYTDRDTELHTNRKKPPTSNRFVRMFEILIYMEILRQKHTHTMAHSIHNQCSIC